MPVNYVISLITPASPVPLVRSSETAPHCLAKLFVNKWNLED